MLRREWKLKQQSYQRLAVIFFGSACLQVSCLLLLPSYIILIFLLIQGFALTLLYFTTVHPNWILLYSALSLKPPGPPPLYKKIIQKI